MTPMFRVNKQHQGKHLREKITPKDLTILGGKEVSFPTHQVGEGVTSNITLPHAQQIVEKKHHGGSLQYCDVFKAMTP